MSALYERSQLTQVMISSAPATAETMVNPNLGYSVDEAFLYREYRKAREAGEEAFRGFMSKHANVEIGLALRSDRWAGADFWEQQGRRVSLDDILQR